MEVKNGCQKQNNTNIESSVTTIGLYLQKLVVKADTIKSIEFWNGDRPLTPTLEAQAQLEHITITEGKIKNCCFLRANIQFKIHFS